MYDLIEGSAKHLQNDGELWLVCQSYIPLTSLISISSFGFGASTSYSDGRFCVHRLSIGTIKEEENSSSGGPTLCLCYLINANEIKWRLAINLSM